MKKISFHKIKKHWIALIMASMVVVSIISAIMLVLVWITSRVSVEKRIRETAQQEALMVEKVLQDKLDRMDTLREIPDIQALRVLAAAPVLEQFKEENHFSDILIFGTDGKSIPYSDQKESLDISSREYFQSAISGMTYLRPMMTKNDNEGVLFRVIPILDDSDHIVGVIEGVISLNEVSDSLSRVRIGETDEANLLDEQGMFLTTPRFAAELPVFEFWSDTGIASEKFTEALEEKTVEIGTYCDYRDEATLGAFAPLKVGKLNLIVEYKQDFQEAYRERDQKINLWLGLLAGSVLILFSMVIFVVVRLLFSRTAPGEKA